MMGIDLRFPNINAPTTEGQMAQMQSYMHQLVQQLNWALNTISDAQSGNASSVAAIKASKDISPKEAENTFNSIKALIIKSADIVKAYEETMTTNYNGEYIAVSDFGTYMAETDQRVETNSEYTRESFAKVETITSGLDKEIRETNAYIQRGFLGSDKETGEAAYGIAVGETDANGVYRGYAWFTADKLTFFDENEYPVAVIGNGCLRIIGKSQFDGDVRFGGYMMDTSEGIAFTWVG